MANPIVDVLESGAVCLGTNIVCDGFAQGCSFRVQTHAHDDHMGDFNKSKGLQDFLLSPETYALLIAEYNADLEYRENFRPIERGLTHELEDGSTLLLSPSNHMLGACQVAITLTDGRTVGYSGDFGWPLDHVIEVEELVVDSTYGSPGSVRGYRQDEAEACLAEVVRTRLRYGSVHIRAHRGTVERVLQVLGDDIGVPILASDRLIKEVEIYQAHGFAVGALVALDSDNGRHALGQRSYVRLYSKGDGFRNEMIEGTTVICSAYMVDLGRPLREFSERAYSVALSNHADFDETLAYVEATGARTVITDNTRNKGCELAIALNQRLHGVQAMPSTNRSGLGGRLRDNRI